MIDQLPASLLRLLRETPALREAYLVGGCVRDFLLDLPVKDYDVEVFGLGYEELARALAPWGKTDLVGRSFGVIKLRLGELVVDFTIPRRDSKTAPGHKGFSITFEPALEPRDAAARRDFTINSLMFDARDGRLLDFFEGGKDLRARVLRHTSDAFPEDPLRVLRGMQFCARFGLTAHPTTIELSRQIKNSFAELAVERIREEWFKWAAKSIRPSLGLHFLAESDWISHFPELDAIRGVKQDPEWHPEGDVFTHTAHCCDALATLPAWQNSDEETRIVLMLATLCHDLGKATTTVESLRGGVIRIVSPGHDEAGETVADSFLRRINAPLFIRQRVLPLVRNHMVHYQNNSDKAIRRLAKRLEPENIRNLITLMSADSLGRPPRPARIPQGVLELERRAADLAVHQAAPKPLLQGRHLLDAGLSPGPQFSQILGEAYEAQLGGEFADLGGALAWFRQTHPPSA